MDVKMKLDEWAKRTGGTYQASVSLKLHTDSMDINLTGTSYEEALSKLKDIVEVKQEIVKESLKDTPTPTSTPATPVVSTPPPTPTPPVAVVETLKPIAEVLNGKTLVRMHDTMQPLRSGESILSYGGLQYVVREQK